MMMQENEQLGDNGRNQDHDQLPSVEVYKTQVGYRSSTSRNKPDPSGVASCLHYSSAPKAVNDLEEQQHNQLPNVEEYKLNLPPQSMNRQFWKIIAFGVLVVVILLTIGVIPLTRSNNKQLWWMKHSDRYAAFEEYLIAQGISQRSALENDSSPQHQAAKWMANKDGMQLPIPRHESLDFVERYVFAVLYFSTGGPNWKYQLNFLTDNHVCTWYQSFVLDTNDADVDQDYYINLGIHGCRLVDDDELVPFAIFLPNNNLVGSLPQELEFLDRLEILNLPFNDKLGGLLPLTLSKMDKLRHIGFQWCSFRGTIPAWIGRLTNLVYFGIGNNLLTGTVPPELARLDKLELLGLDDNMLSANITVFQTLKSIKSLYLEDNLISGTLSDALLASWTKLQELDLSNNQLSGSLPEDLFHHFNDLRVMDLSQNRLSGTLPTPAWEDFSLQVLALDGNKFHGEIPSALVNFKGLRHLDLSSNDFGSTLPETLGQMTPLEYLFVGNNPYESATVPPFLMKLTSLHELGMWNSRLKGRIPDFISDLSNLEILDFHSNALTGSIPTQLGELTHLKHLLFKSNQLTGTIPTELGQLTKLNVLLLEQNHLEGSVEFLCQINSSDNPLISHLVSDCGSRRNFAAAMVECSCCTTCCSNNDDDETCNEGCWDGSMDVIWEYGFRRGRYSYDMGSGSILKVP